MHKVKKLRAKSISVLLALGMAFAPGAVLAGPTVNVTAGVPNVMDRLGGADRYETAVKISQAGWTTAEYAVLSAGMDDNLVDALTVAPLAKQKNAPILLTEGNSLPAVTQAELQRLNVKTVYVTSGIGVIKQAVLDQLNSMGIAVKSLGGKDRFETAVNVAKELPKIERAIVATAYTNADALSVAPIAAYRGIPILLTEANTLNETTQNYLKDMNIVRGIYVMGGTGAVSDDVLKALPQAVRVGGVDRFDTNRKILRTFANEYKDGQVYLANGQNAHIVDALAGSSLAARSGSPVLLTDNDLTPESKEYARKNMLAKTITALGGEGVVAPAALKALSTGSVYADSGVTIDSTEPGKSFVIDDSLKVTGDNVSLKNAKITQNVYVQGNKATFTNVEIQGTLFIDPGPKGDMLLDNVTADNIVVLSGAKESLTFINSKGNLKVDADVRVAAQGTTVFPMAVINSNAIIDAAAAIGAFPNVEVGTNDSGESSSVEFSGTIGDVYVTGEVRIIAGQATITNISVAPVSETSTVTLVGNFVNVDVNKPANVVVEGTTTNMTVNANATVDASKGTVTNLTVASNVQQQSGTGTTAAPVVQVVAGTVNSVVVAGEATFVAAPAATVTKVELAPTVANTTITLQGTIAQVVVSNPTNVTVAENTTIKTVTNNSGTTVTVSTTTGAPATTVTTGTTTTAPVVTGGTTTTTPSGGGGGGTSYTTPSTPTTTTATGNLVPTTGSNVSGTVTRTGTAVSIAATSTTLSEVTIKVLRADGTILYVNVAKAASGTTSFADSFTLPADVSGNITFVVGQGSNVGTATIAAK